MKKRRLIFLSACIAIVVGSILCIVFLENPTSTIVQIAWLIFVLIVERTALNHVVKSG